MTPQVQIDVGALVYSILLNIPSNYHPMNLLPAFAPTSNSNISDLFTKPLSLSRHRFTTTTLIGDLHSPAPSTSVASTVDSVTTASAVVDSFPTATTASASVPTILPIVLDTGATRTPFPSDFCVAQASYGLFRSPISVVSKALASTPVDPHTLITGEDVSVDFDLSSPDALIDSDSGPSVSFDSDSFTKVHFDIRAFGTATLTFIYSKSTSELLHILLEPTQIDWLHWVPLPRLILPESYCHIFGLDYLQAFTLFHLIPIWIYFLLHFAVNLE